MGKQAKNGKSLKEERVWEYFWKNRATSRARTVRVREGSGGGPGRWLWVGSHRALGAVRRGVCVCVCVCVCVSVCVHV